MEFYNYLIFFNYLLSVYLWPFFEFCVLIVWIIFIKRNIISSKISAVIAFILLFFSMVFVIAGNDRIAGKISEFTLIFLVLSAVQAFIIELKNSASENGKKRK